MTDDEEKGQRDGEEYITARAEIRASLAASLMGSVMMAGCAHDQCVVRALKWADELLARASEKEEN